MAGKGSSFERLICKQLSRWWSEGERDDIFWRSSQSGGRATQRAKSGRKTYGSYGDIAATDPIGEPLLRFFTIELKIGRSHGDVGDFLDFKDENACHKWSQTLKQAIRSHNDAGSLAWLLICKRDFRRTMVYLANSTLMSLPVEAVRGLLHPPLFRHRVIIVGLGKVDVIGMPLDKFLLAVKPRDLRDWR